MGGRGSKLPKASIVPMLHDTSPEALDEYAVFLSEAMGRDSDAPRINKAFEEMFKLKEEQGIDTWKGRVNVTIDVVGSVESVLNKSIIDTYYTLRELGVPKDVMRDTVEFIIFGEPRKVSDYMKIGTDESAWAYYKTLNKKHFTETGIVIRDSLIRYAFSQKHPEQLTSTMMHEWGHAVTINYKLLKNPAHQDALGKASDTIMRALSAAEDAGWTGKSPIEMQDSYILQYYKKDPIGTLATRTSSGYNRIVEEVLATSFSQVGMEKLASHRGRINAYADPLSKYLVKLFAKE